MGTVVNVFIEFELVGSAEQFEAIFREIVALAHGSGRQLHYAFFRDPARPERIFALESHPDGGALAAHFERSLPLLQKAWGCARPVQTIILGDVPQEMKAEMKRGGVTLAPCWIGEG